MPVSFDPFSQPAVQPITTKGRIAGGQIIFQPEGSDREVNLGGGSVEWTPNLTEVDTYTTEFGDRRLTGSYAVTKDGTIGVTLNQWTESVYQALFMSAKTYLTQEAVVSATLVKANVDVGNIFRVPGVGATVSAVTDGAESDPVSLAAGTHYTFHKGTGRLQIIALPEDFGTDIEISYTLPAITAADKILDLGFMSSGGLRGRLSVVNVIGEGMPGIGSEAVFNSVEFRPNGAVPFINNEGENQATLNGRMFAVANVGAAKAYGHFRTFGAV